MPIIIDESQGSAPTLPTLVSITTEGLKKAGYSNPSSAKLTRAQNEWMEEIKNDIYHTIKDPIVLHTTGIVILSEGTQIYSLPVDFAKLETAKLLYGDQTGTAQSGSTTTITLAAASTFTEDWIKGKYVLTTGGTGSAQEAMVTSYNTTTKQAAATFSTAPDSTTTYMIIDTEYPLEIGYLQNFDKEMYPMNKNRPTIIYETGDEDNGEFITLENPDKTYGVRLRYYTNIMEVDLSSTLMSAIYLRWRNIWIQGIKAKTYEDDDDDRAQVAMAEYRQMINGLLMRERYGMELSELQVTVS